MTRRLVRNIIIAVAAVVLLGGGYYFALKWEPNKEVTPDNADETAAETVYIVNETSDAVESLNIQNENGAYSMVKTKNADGIEEYVIPELGGAEVRVSSVSAAFGSLIKLSASKTITEDTARAAEFGLDTPSASVVINKADGSSITVRVGDEAPAGGEFYCMTDAGDAIYTIGSYKADYMFNDMNSYRVTAIVNISAETDITGFSVYHDSEPMIKIGLFEEGDNAVSSMTSKWMVEYPWRAETADDRVAELFKKFLAVEATGFADNASGVNFDYSVEIQTADSAYSFGIGGEAQDGGVYLKDNSDGKIYIVSADLRTAVTGINPSDYISKLVRIANISNTKRVVIRRGDTEYIMEPGREASDDDEGKAYIINGETIDEKAFKSDYQTVIGITLHEQGAFNVGGEPYMTITYEFDNGAADTTSYYEFDERDFVAKRSDGSTVKLLRSEIAKIEKLISR